MGARQELPSFSVFSASKGRYYAKNLGSIGNDVTDILPGKYGYGPIKSEWVLFD